MELDQAIVQRVLDAMPVARLAVHDHSDRADAMPIVFARVGDSLFSPIDGKPKKNPRLARLAHIRRRPSVTLVLDHYDDDWRNLWWLRVQAQAQVSVGDHPQWDAAVAALKGKYHQYQTTPLFLGEPTLIVMPWSGIKWWAAEGSDGLARWLAAAEGGGQS